jgi:hypothetical protein
MNTFSRVAIVMVGMTGLAAAQPKAGDAKAADPKMAPKTADAKAADPKMAPKMADAKAGGMPEMKPPPELADMAKATTGTWRCKGQGMDMQAGKMIDMTATMKMKPSLNGWWMQASFESKMGKETFAFESFTTFDPSSKKWKRVMIETGGGWGSGESNGMTAGKVDWDMKVHSPRGDGMFKDHEDMSDAKAGVKMSGEISMDNGKSFNNVYSMTCKK